MRTTGVRLIADVADYGRKMRGAGQEARNLKGDLEKASSAGKLDHVTTAAAGLGLGLVGAAGMAVKFSMDFDKQMSAVRAATHASTADMARLRQASLDAGADTKYSATEAAKGVEELSKAGIATSDILGGGLKGALSLASAGEMDVGDAAEIAATAMTQFNLKGGAVGHVADLLAAGAGKAQGSVADLGLALKYAGLPASNLGISIEETSGTLALFASNGLLGEQAGTGLRGVLASLTAPSGKANDTMQELGLQVYDASGKFVGMANVAEQLRVKLGGVSAAQRDAALATIFGREAMPAAIALMKAGAKGVQDWTGKVDDAGYAAETAAMKTDNLAGDIERLKGSLETEAIKGGSGLNGGLRVLTKSTGALVDQFGQLPPAVSGTVTVLAAAGGAAGLLGVGYLKLRTKTGEMLTELREVGPGGERAARGLQSTTRWAGRAAVAFAAFEVAGAAVHAMQSDLNPQVDALAKGLADYGTSGKLAGESSRVLGADLGDLETGFKFLADGDNARREAVKNMQQAFESLPIGLDGTNTSLSRTKQRIDAMDQALAQLVSSGNPAEAKSAFDRIAKTLATGGVSMDEFRKQFPAYTAALEVATPATTKTATAVDDVASAAKAAAQRVEDLTKSFDQLFDQQMDVDRATIAYRDNIRALVKELKSGSRTTDVNTEEGRKNRSAVLDQIEAINKLRKARVEHGESMDSANKKYVRDIDGLRKTMRQAGFTEKQIKELTDKYRAMPAEAETKVSAPGAVKAEKQIRDFNFTAKKVDPNVSTKVSVKGQEAASAKLNELLVMQAALKKGVPLSVARKQAKNDRQTSGGYRDGGWTGPGVEDAPAGIVHADEHVIRKKSRRRMEQQHPGLLDHVNTYGELPPGYAGGGRVMWPFPVSARGTRIPSVQEAANAVAPQFPGGGGATDDMIVRAVHSRFPDLNWISKFRPGARTLTGNRSLHSMHRAVDWPANHALALWWNHTYGSRTKELITPWNELNIHNGRPHRYTGAVWNQHNFAGGNAHDHIAMRGGGVIKEPVYGYGLSSGRSYSFAESGPERVIPGVGGAGGEGTTLNVTVQFSGPVGSQRELESWLARAVDNLKYKGRI